MRIIKFLIGGLFLAAGVTLCVYSTILFFGGNYWVGGYIGLGVFSISVGAILLFKLNVHDIF